MITLVVLGATNVVYARPPLKCNDGAFHASTADSADPEYNVECQILARAFCMVEEDRISGQPASYAISRASEWLSGLGRTGSHVKTNHRKQVVPIADYVYAHDKMPPWTMYNYAVYTCGLNKRVASEKAKESAVRWEAEAAACIKESPGEGDGRSNQKLKDCLLAAMEAIARETKATSK